MAGNSSIFSGKNCEQVIRWRSASLADYPDLARIEGDFYGRHPGRIGITSASRIQRIAAVQHTRSFGLRLDGRNSQSSSDLVSLERSRTGPRNAAESAQGKGARQKSESGAHYRRKHL